MSYRHTDSGFQDHERISVGDFRHAWDPLLNVDSVWSDELVQIVNADLRSEEPKWLLRNTNKYIFSWSTKLLRIRDP
jgi:hypothetical protein